MNSKEKVLEQIKNASSAEEVLAAAKANGVEMTEEESRKYYECIKGNTQLSDEDLGSVVGGQNVGWKCFCGKGPLPDPACTGIGFLFGLDACRCYVETADPNGRATPYTYPVLCTCTEGYFKDIPMNRPYQS